MPRLRLGRTRSSISASRRYQAPWQGYWVEAAAAARSAAAGLGKLERRLRMPTVARAALAASQQVAMGPRPDQVIFVCDWYYYYYYCY